MASSSSSSTPHSKLPAAEKRNLIVLGSDDDDDEEEEVELDQAQVLKVQKPMKVTVNGTVGPDKEEKLASMLPKALVEAAKRAVAAHRNSRKQEKSNHANKPKMTVEEDDDIQVEYENVKRVRKTTVPLVLDKELHNQVVSAIRASPLAAAAIASGCSGSQNGGNIINAKLGENATLSVSIVSSPVEPERDRDETQRRNISTEKKTADNMKLTNGASSSSSSQMTKLKTARDATSGVQKTNNGFHSELPSLVKREEEEKASREISTTPNKCALNRPDNRSDKGRANGPSTSKSSSQLRTSNSQGHMNGSLSEFEAFIQQQQRAEESGQKRRKRFQSQFTDFVQQQSKDNDKDFDAEIPDLKPEGLVRKRRRTCREGDDDPPLPALTPSVRKQVGKRTKPKAERVRAGNLEAQRRFMLELEINMIEGTAFVPIGIFRQMFTAFEVDLHEIMLQQGAAAHFRFRGWAMSEISLALASKLLCKRGGSPEVVSEGFLQLARRHPVAVIMDWFDEDGEKNKTDKAVRGRDLNLPKLGPGVIKNPGKLTPLFRTAKKPVRASLRLQAQVREQRLDSERSKSPDASPALPQTAAMEKKGINLPKGWVIQVLQPPPMSKYKYVSPDGKTFRSLEKAMAYGKTAPNNSAETASTRRKKNAVVADKHSNAGKFVCNEDFEGDGEGEGGKGMTLHEIAERKRAACRKFASNADLTRFRGLADDSGRVPRRRRKKKVLVKGPAKATMPGTLSLNGLKVRPGGCDGWFAKKVCLVKALSEPLKKVHGGEEERVKKRRGASGGPRRRSDRVKVTFSRGNEEILDLDEWSVATALKEADGENGAVEEDALETTAEVALRIQETSHGRASQAWEWRRKSNGSKALVGKFVSPEGKKEELIVRGKDGRVSKERGGEGVIAAHEVMEEFGPRKLAELFLE